MVPAKYTTVGSAVLFSSIYDKGGLGGNGNILLSSMHPFGVSFVSNANKSSINVMCFSEQA